MSFCNSNIIQISDANNAVNTHSFSLFSINVRSLNQHHNLLVQLVEDLNHPTVLALSELWNCNDLSSQIPSYYHIMKLRDSRQGGGVGIWVKNNIKSHSSSILDSIPLTEIEMVSRIIELETTKIGIVSLYRPPNANLKKCLEEIRLILEHCEKIELKIYIVGDFNIDLLKNNSVAKSYEDIVLNYQYLQTVHSPTRINKNSSTMIDHVLINSKVKAFSSVVNCSVADHLGILTVSNQNILKKVIQNDSKLFSVIDSDLLSEKLNKVDWNKWIAKRMNLNTDETFASFHRLVSKFLKEATVMKKRTNNKYVPRNPWITFETLSIKKEADKYRKKFLKSNSAYHFNKSNELYKFYKSQIRKNKNDYYLDKFRMAGKDSKKIWQLINQALGRNLESSSSSTIPKLSFAGQTIEDPKVAVECFNNYFKNVASNIADKIPKPQVDFSEFLNLNTRTFESLSLKPISQDDVLKVINSLKPKNSSGFDNISNSLIKKIAPALVSGLTYCINKSINEGTFPSTLKTSKVLPLFKSGDENLTTNYRPISQLSAFSKIFEKLILLQCNEFLIANNITHDLQFGFREGHSTNHAILLTMSELESAKNQNLFSIIISIDLKKAFDTVNVSSILPAKLDHYYNNEKTTKFLASFFKSRKQFIQMNDVRSSTINNYDISVCQGSSLGPPMFSLYINDLASISRFRTILFADDTNLILSSRNLKQLEKEANEELIKIQQYLIANKLSLNVTKTTFSIIAPRGKSVGEKITLKIGKENIKEVDQFKFLGVLIHKNFKFKDQFEKVVEKVKKGVNALTAAKRFLNYNAKLQVYHSLIHSHITYCCLSWLSKISKKQLKILITLQKRALRALFCARYNSHTDILFELSRITKVEDIVEREYLKLMYEFKEKKLPTAINDLISKYTTSNKTVTRHQRNEFNYTLNGFRKGDIIYDMVHCWNSSNSEIKEISYEMPSVKHRINKLQRDRYNFDCNRESCFSCFRTNRVQLEDYMTR